jgi:ADP-heptose:LPS heptosyltransferase
MKTLVLQLARLGDIYQTWPVLRALKRLDPEGELHVLTRSKFAAALEGLEAVDQHWPLDSRSVLAPLIDEKPDFDASFFRIDELCDGLVNAGFDRIINLSFSPLSSYIASEITQLTTEVHGYTRTSDGYLAIPDDPSAYFYAQVGVGRGNRAHVTDLFAAVAGVELTVEDFRAPQLTESERGSVESLESPIVIHVGASDLAKTLSWSKWLQVVKGLLAQHEGDVVLVGSAEERALAEQISPVGGSRSVINKVGQTSLRELTALIGKARLFIGGDSGPMQIASLTGTPVLNVSFPIVSPWETGPKSAGSRIVQVVSEEKISADEIVSEAMAMLTGRPPVVASLKVHGPVGPYQEVATGASSDREFEWELIQGLYMGAGFPSERSTLFREGLKRLGEVNDLALEQISVLRVQPGNVTAAGILDRADEIMGHISRMVPEAAPLVRWFQTERMRIGPMPVDLLADCTAQVHLRLREVLKVYEQGPAGHEGVNGHDDVVLGS